MEGRVGYSVKIVSKAALEASEFQIGGSGEPEGPIINPPPDDF